MKVIFSLQYFVNPQEELKIIVNNQTQKPLPMTYDGKGFWQAEFETDKEHFSYYYGVYKNGRQIRAEYAFPPRNAYPSAEQTFYKDCWRDTSPLSFMYTFPFNKENTYRCAPQPESSKKLVIKAYAPQLQLPAEYEGSLNNYTLKICGAKELGGWDTLKARSMTNTALNEWTIILDAAKLTPPLEFKFIAEQDGKTFWQQGGNNILNFSLSEGQTLVESSYYPVFESRLPKAAGIVVPVFSLRSEKSFGVGDFGDLKKLADWAAKTGQKFIQILPINDTTVTGTWLDSYPYNSISIYALHPMYMDLNELGPLSDKNKENWFQWECKRLNSYPQVNYEEVNLLKRAYIKMIFYEKRKETFCSEEYKKFFEENKHWLKPYAAFRLLRDKYGTPDFSKWQKYAVYSAQEVENLTSPESIYYKDISFFYFKQFHLYRQLAQACSYARSKAVAVKGDIPIGISRNSVEAWAEPHYFNMDRQAGAPPDDFSADGQNWGFPTYNWAEMAKDGYKWWRKRFKNMAKCFDAYRIDHILGFFRIWSIPSHAVTGLLGQFDPALPLSVDEIKSFGFNITPEHLLPSITEDLLTKMFGAEKEKIKILYLDKVENGLFAMKQGFKTQKEVQAYFRGKKSAKDTEIKQKLFSLIGNVLFVADKNNPALFHPRISALKAPCFEDLEQDQKTAYTNLYNNFFYQRHNEFWRQSAMAKLPSLLAAERMLPCAEDLGMIPACVPQVLEELQILSLEVQRMPKEPGNTFGNSARYPYLSVCTPSTHDMSTLRGWWQENPGMTQKFYTEVLGKSGAAPKDAAPEICEEIIKQQLNSPSLLCLISFQDWMSIDGKKRCPDIESERINIPANPRHYWRYRMHLNLEQLINDEELNSKISSLTKQSGR